MNNCVSKPQWAHLDFVWRIEDFWELRALASIQALDDENGDVLWSPAFGDGNRGIWRLKVYPFGDTSPAGKGHVSVFLAFDYQLSAAPPPAGLGKPKVYAIFSCAALDAQGAKIQASGRSFTRQKFAEGSSSWGWSQFIKGETDAASTTNTVAAQGTQQGGLQSLLIEEGQTLVLKCSIDLFLGVKTKGPSYGGGVAIGGSSPPLTADLQSFLNTPLSHNLQLVCRGRTITANRTALAARSEAFRRLLFQDPNQAAPAATTGGSPTRSSSPGSTGAAAGSAAGGYAASGKSPSVGSQILRIIGSNTVEVVHEDLPFTPLQNFCIFALTDTCPPLTTAAEPLAELLELLMASVLLECRALAAACVSRLSERMCSKADAALVLAVADKYSCVELAAHARRFLEQCASDLDSKQVLQLLMSNAVGSSSTDHQLQQLSDAPSLVVDCSGGSTRRLSSLIPRFP